MYRIENFSKFDCVPYSLEDKVKLSFEKMLEQQILEPVTYLDWATPVWVVSKKSGKIKIYDDYKVTVNNCL